MIRCYCRVVRNEKLKDRFYRIRLKSNRLASLARPGQFVHIRIVDGITPLLRRPFSFHRVLGEEVELLYEIKGQGTQSLAQKRPGEHLDVIGPLGNGFRFKKGNPAVLVAGGIGVVPLLFLAHMLKGGKVYIGAKTKKGLLCVEDFKRLGWDVMVSTEDGSGGKRGKIIDFIEDVNLPMFVCGPWGLLKKADRVAFRYGVECQVLLEEYMACGIGVCLGCPVKTKSGYKMVCKDGPVFDSDDIVWD